MAALILKTDKAIVVAVISALTIAIGWIVAHYFTRSREIEARAASEKRADNLRRLELNLQQIDRRIAELYGPIHNMLTQINVIWSIKHEKMKPVLADDIFAKVGHFLEQKHFADLHDRIRVILREKTHLVEDGEIPHSFYEYMEHSLMQNIQIDLWEIEKISTLQAEGHPYSDKFQDQIKYRLLSALQQRQALIDQLKPQ